MSQITEYECEYDTVVNQDFDKAEETAENIADSSMDEVVGDVSFDGCVFGNSSITERARGRKRTRNADIWQRNKNKRSCNT